MLNTGAISRAAKGLGVDHILALDARRAALGYDQLGEIQQQFQFPVSGTATATIGWTEMDVTFDVEFYNATEQRDIPYTVPHFTCGAVVESGDPVLITACVRAWTKRADDAVTGAKLAVGVLSGTFDDTQFDGYLHVAFEGYGAPSDQGADLEAPTG